VEPVRDSSGSRAFEHRSVSLQYTTHEGVTLSSVGLGSYGAGGAYGPHDPKEFVRLVRRAVDLGVTFFDTAEAYGDAERLLGEGLGAQRNAVLVATKVGLKRGVEPTLSRQYVLDACNTSLTNLGTDYIDLYQVHFDDPDTPVEETIGALEELARAGKIRRYGLGHLRLERVREYCASGNVFSVLMELSAVEPSARDRLLPFCRANGVGGIAFSVTGRGVLTGRLGPNTVFDSNDIRSIDPLFQRERLRSALRVLDRISQMAGTMGKTPAQIAIAWVLAQPGVICALTGPSTASHLEENAAAADLVLPRPEIDQLESFLTRERARLQEEQRSTVRRILQSPLARDPAKAFKDLVYAVETSLALGLVSEEAVVPTFRDLFALRGELEGAVARLVEIQGLLERLVLSGGSHEPQ
jgi:aryl-alcohol dehydrogenase-like predicted oxidoreductase